MKFKTIFCFCLVLLGAAPCFPAQTSPQRSPRKTSARAAVDDKAIVTTIRELEETLRRAALHGDSTWWERHLDDNYVGIDPQGGTSTKTDAIQLHSSSDLKYDEVNFGDFTLRTYNGDTVVLTGLSTISGSYKGKDFSGQYHFVQVWIKEGDEWKLTVSQTDKMGP